MPTTPHEDFSAGMVQDSVRHLLPTKAMWECYDAFLNQDGHLSQRGAAIVAQAAASVISPAHMMILDSNEVDDVLRGILYDESGGVGTPIKTAAFTPGAGTTTISAVLSSINAGWVTASGGGRPARYFNRILRPNGIPASIAASHQYRPFSIYGGGAHVQTSRTGTVAIAVTLGDNLLTGFAVADTAAMEIGNVVRLVGAANEYLGRIVEIPTTTTIRVSPTPTASFSTGANTWQVASVLMPNLRTAQTWIIGARSLTTWGDRVVLGGVAYDLLNANTKLDIHSNRIAWGILPVVDSAVAGAITYDGFRENGMELFLARNFTDIMAMETILGLEPINSGELLVLGYPRLHRVVGYFATQTTQTGGSLTWEVRPIEDRVSCVSDAATDSTPQGVCFAAPDGVFLYHGGRATDIMRGRIKNLYIDTLLAGATITGGGYIGNDHYYVSTSTGWFLCNMAGMRWQSGGLSSIGGVAADPSRPNRYYGHRKNPGTVSDTTKLFRLDTVLQPGAANKVDANPGWAGPAMRLQTRVFTEGDVQRLKRTNHVYLTLRQPGGSGTVTITATPGVDAEETPIVLGTFANATSAQMKRFMLNVLSRGMALKIEKTAGAPDEIEFVGLKVASVRLNEYRDA